jgi:hypothetical protein
MFNVRHVLCLAGLLLPTALSAQDLLQSLGKSARDTKQSASIVGQLLGRKDLGVTDVLTAMKSQDDVARNYYLSVAQAVADRNPQQAVEQCKRYIEQLSQDPTGRYWAFSYVTTYEPALKEKLLESMIDDPSPELRFEAVELRLKRLESSATGTANWRNTLSCYSPRGCLNKYKPSLRNLTRPVRKSIYSSILASCHNGKRWVHLTIPIRLASTLSMLQKKSTLRANWPRSSLMA